METNNNKKTLEFVFDEVYSYFFDENDNITEHMYNEFLSFFNDTLQTFYPEFYNVVNNNIKNIIQIKYIISLNIDNIILPELKIVSIYDNKCESVNNINTDTSNKNNEIINFNKKFMTYEERNDYYNKHRNNEILIDINKLTARQKKLYNHYEHLTRLPQPEQKKPEWFEKRKKMISASNSGASIGKGHGVTIKSALLDKLELSPKFKENKYVYHGKKYEFIANMIYEFIYNTKTGEFGLLQHPTIDYLGASPDGISMILTLDGKINKLLGRMLEIKCPPQRVILCSGQICGDICPEHYWVQVQQQLECCDLDECDFWQCLITEYDDEETYNLDEVNDLVHSENQKYDQDENTVIIDEPVKIKINPLIRKGAIIELLPIDRSNILPTEQVEWYGKYIYPPTLLMSPAEYKIWTTDIINNLSTLYPEMLKEYKFSRIVYWKLEKSHNELIMRQPKWFEANKHLFKLFWDRILYYREHKEEAITDIVEQRLTNNFLLKTKTAKIPILKEKENIFIKPSTSNKIKDKSDIFLTSSDNTVQKTKTCNKNTEIKPIPKPIPLYKNNKNNDPDPDDMFISSEKSNKNNKENEEELMIITENRKKKYLKN